MHTHCNYTITKMNRSLDIQLQGNPAVVVKFSTIKDVVIYITDGNKTRVAKCGVNQKQSMSYSFILCLLKKINKIELMRIASLL